MKRKFKIFTTAFIIFQLTTSGAYAATYSNLKDVQNDLYNNALNRETSYTFYYDGDTDRISEDLINIVKEAYFKDDYTGKSWSRISYNAEGKKKKIKITVNSEFVTTKEEEDYINENLNSIVKSIIKPEMSEYEKVKTIHDYIKNRYSYDDDLYSFILKLNNGQITDNTTRNEVYRSTSVYSALNSNKTVCQGYAMTAYKMLKGAGIECKIISGTLKGQEHVWNKVKVNGIWYYLDITADDTSKTDDYFLVSDSVLTTNQYDWTENSTENIRQICII